MSEKKKACLLSLPLFLPGVTKECFLEALKYLKTSKQHGTL